VLGFGWCVYGWVFTFFFVELWVLGLVGLVIIEWSADSLSELLEERFFFYGWLDIFC